MAIAEQSSKTAQQPTGVPYEGVGRQAWILLWIAFGVFIIMLVGIPLTLNWYLHNATSPLPARVERIRGTTLVVKADTEEATAVIEVMDMQEGDIIRTLRANKDYIGHYHTGGNPGRNEIDDTQELYYPAIMQAIAKTGYTGYVAHEFVPKRDPLQSLTYATRICDV